MNTFLFFAQDGGGGATISDYLDYVGNSIYGVLAVIALWGLYLVVMVWRRVGAKRFKNEAALNQFMDMVDEPLLQSDFDGVLTLCERNKRAKTSTLMC